MKKQFIILFGLALMTLASATTTTTPPTTLPDTSCIDNSVNCSDADLVQVDLDVDCVMDDVEWQYAVIEWINGTYSEGCLTRFEILFLCNDPAIYPGCTPTVQLPNSTYGTLPPINGSGGIMNGSINGGILNTSAMGPILGNTTSGFLAIITCGIVLLVLTTVKPFKVGISLSAIATDFFALVMIGTSGAWLPLTASVLLVINFLAAATWFVEGQK